MHLDDETEAVGRKILDAAFEVHKNLGPGLLESAYEACLEREIQMLGFSVQRQVPLPIHYKDVVLDEGYRLDLVIEGKVLVELKAVSVLTAVHEAQIISYLKLSGYHLGFLINFHETLLKNGLRRFII